MVTSEMMEISMQNYYALRNGTPRTSEMRTYSNLRNACAIFSHRAFQDIRSLHKEERKERGISAVYNKYKNDADGKPTDEILFFIKIMTYCIAGRIMVTIKNEKEDSITLVGGEDDVDSIAGFHAIDCDPDVALDMLEILEDEWYTLYDKRGANNINKFKIDKQIKIAGT